MRVVATAGDLAGIQTALGLFPFGFTCLRVGLATLGGLDPGGSRCPRVAIIMAVYSPSVFFCFGYEPILGG